ncbi:MAG: fumarylacetoacetate hydrolase family protein [Saprospiraceae bacterium]|nr:fumarylacetoacetate hydrolase family protein [Saprospiraceae bacterium]
MLKKEDHDTIAARLDEAARHAHAVAQISHAFPLTLDDAYAIQALSIDRRIARGEQLAGFKMGFTSRAKMEQMGVHDMIWGRLTDAMHIPDGGTLHMDRLIHPRAEPEICFRFDQDVDQALSVAEVKTCVDAVAPAIEVIDSRYEHFKFSLEDVIADNCSSAAFVVGTWHPADTPLDHLKISLAIDEAVVHEGASTAILGDPWESVAAATRLITGGGVRIPAGCVLMAGAATPAVYLKRGQQVAVKIDQLGGCSFLTQ